MNYQIVLVRPWHYRHPKHGRAVLEAGTYAVPGQVVETVALRALAEGVARRIEAPRATTVAPAAKPLRKGPAPKRKALGPAPENKSSLV